ncbi:nucleolar protein 6 [Olea europaea var. sylvestris]|uniref:nucleolar protein 6 n=1 Tax=Olea europaea var. sylvestris TaxID=158386 RepID=UPI000C1CE5B7|nr:nucleolar protein 6 [Olea europaea var. sylvestris]
MGSEAGIQADSTNLKLRELLKETQLDYSSENTKIINDVVSALKEAIDQIPEDFQVAADTAPGFVKDIGADKVEFKFKKPKSIEIGGSYSFKCAAKPDVHVDLFLRLPKECFYEKDYLNYRYHAKRFLYLCIIKKYVKLSSIIQEVKWSTFHNEARKPVLVVYPAARLSGNAAFCVKIIPTSKSIFCVSKLNLQRNNVRSLNQEGVLQATPKYNSSILEDMFLEDNFEFVKRTFMGWKELGEALILLKVWARQRSSIYAHDCLSGFLIAIIMAYLASKSSKNRINKSVNVIQILRITLDFIANSKVWDHGLYFQPEVESNISNKDRRKEFQLFPVIICDSFGVNLAFRMSLSGFQELRDEAALALSCIDKCKDGGFDEMFMTKIDFPAKFDYCTRLNLKGSREVYSCGFCLDEECWRTYEQKVLSLIDQALRGRTKLVRVIWRNATSECNIEDGLSTLDGEELLIGISINSVEEAFKQAVMGPSSEEKDKAVEFRKFWGDKATLRWFRDGKIAEVAVWEHEESERHLIIKEIIEHVLSRHLSLPKENIISIVDQLDFSLCLGNKDPITFSANLLKAFDNLSKHLRLLDDIPLRVSSVQPLDSAFRLTSVFPPQPHPLAYEDSVGVKPQKLTSTCIQPLEVMIQLEGSGNWPMDELAMEKTKSAFLMKIGESLQEKWGISCTATEEDVDVFTSGYAFRLKILHERGLGLVQRQGNAHVKRVLSSDKKLFVCGQHSSMINGLRGRYPIYGPVVRLAKRWVSAHLFSNSLTEDAIELLVAYLFLKPLPFRPPSSRITGFLRFLRLLSEYDWSFSSLIVDINGDLTPQDGKEINDNFMSNRREYRDDMQNISPAMFIATAYDKASEAWTRASPTAAELRRLAAYAASSAKLLTSLIMQNLNDSYRWECLFRTPLNNYNAVILLHRDKLPFPHHLLFPSEINQGRHIVRGNPSEIFHPFLIPGDLRGSLEEMKNKLMVNFDPLGHFTRDIEREFPDEFKVWYDSLGGDAVGLTLRNKSSKKRGRDVNCEDKDLIDSLRAVGELGKGFVRNIYLLKAPKVNS